MTAESTALFAGIGNATLPVERFELGRGVFLRKTYAHLSSPMIMAFAPAPPGRAHPAPWKVAKGGFQYDIHAELCVPQGAELPAGLSAEETVWWLAALLRLVDHPQLVVPILSDMPLSEAANSAAPELRPLEVEPRMLSTPDGRLREIELDCLRWVEAKWIDAAQMLRDAPKFHTALKAYDLSMLRGRTSASMLAVWGALEQLFSPASTELRFRVAANIAAFMEPAGAQRRDLFKKTMNLYAHRSTAAHTASDVELGHFIESWVIARNALMRMVSEEKVPTQADFEDRLFGVVETSPQWSPSEDSNAVLPPEGNGDHG